MKRSIQKGFTLIELMIVVAIIGILAAIALPQYQTYIAKSQFSRVMGESGNIKTAVEQCVLNGNTASVSSNLPAGSTLGATECNLEATASSLMTGAVQGNGVAAPTGTGYVQAQVSTAGVWTIVAEFGNGATTALKGDTAKNKITWSRSVEGTWTCSTTAESNYRAKGCETTTP
jgi:type IV pilus assembly protein PilA